MTIKKSRVLSGLAAALYPVMYAFIQFFRTRNEPFPFFLEPLLWLLIAAVLFLILYRKTPSFYIKETDTGMLIAAARTSLYDPGFVEFSRMKGVSIEKDRFVIELDDASNIELYIPKKYREELLKELNAHISGRA